MDEFMQAAMDYVGQGWAVFPLQPHDKRPYPGTHGFWDAVGTVEEARRAWLQRPGSNVGVATGASKLLVLDVDGDKGAASLDVLIFANGALPTTRRQVTGKGWQWFFQRPDGSRIGNSAGGHGIIGKRLGEGLDVRGQGGYVVVPPSIHPSGRRYRWEDTSDVVAAPAWLLALLEPPPAPPRRHVETKPYTGEMSAYARRAVELELAALSAAPEGQRNVTLNSAAFALGQLVGGGEAGITYVAGSLRIVGLGIGLSEAEVDATIRSGLSAGMRLPRVTPQSTMREAS